VHTWCPKFVCGVVDKLTCMMITQTLCVALCTMVTAPGRLCVSKNFNVTKYFGIPQSILANNAHGKPQLGGERMEISDSATPYCNTTHNI
jgi:hypothetical protein